VALEAGSDPARVRRIAGQFRAMVLMPSTITVRVLTREVTPEGPVIRFEVLNAAGKLAVQHGLIGLWS